MTAIDPLVLLPLGAPAAALHYSYEGRSSTLFVTDPALPGNAETAPPVEISTLRSDTAQ